MKTKTETQDFILRFEESDKPTFTLGMTADIAGTEFKPGFELSEHDGLSCCELYPAVAHLFPKGAKAESNGRNSAWVSHWNDEELTEMAGKHYRVRVARKWIMEDDGTDMDLENQTVELIA